MAARVVFIGDEVGAAGWRLAGVATRVVRRGEETAALRAELADAALILLAQAAAARIAPGELRRAAAAARPLLLVVADAPEADGADIGARVRLQLGLVET